MPQLLILRLIPSEPIDPGVFRNALNGLTITAYDLSFGDSITGTQLGTASGLANPHLGNTTNNNVNLTSKAILQHYVDVTLPLLPAQRHLESAATAVVIVTPPGGGEYPTPESYDLRLEITRGAATIVDRRLDYNVIVDDVGALPTNQKTLFAAAASAYVTLPKSGIGLDPSIAFVDLPPDGQPPAFDAVCAAIDLVLSKDPAGATGDLLHRSPLTIAESRHVAAEIVWNRRADPPPDPSIEIGEMYTKPPVDPTLNADDVDRARMKFEAELKGWYGTGDSEALRLAGYVFSASAAIAAETVSREAARAAIEFPVETGSSTPTTIPRAAVALEHTGGLTTGFGVPAAFFYALTATMPPQVSASHRFDVARFTPEDQLLAQLETAIDSGVLAVPAKPFTAPADPAINPAQAARRLHALGTATSSLTAIDPSQNPTPITALIQAWLDYNGSTATIDTAFWVGQIGTLDYLLLLLAVATESFAALIVAVQAAPLSVTTAAELAAIDDRGWRDFFGVGSAAPNVALLPPFTQPGTPGERADAFIRHLRNFFTIGTATAAPAPPDASLPPLLTLSQHDVFAELASAYAAAAGVPLTFGTPPDLGALGIAAEHAFPGDTDAQAWLVQAVETIETLYELSEGGPAELQFSIIEALYARGFTTLASVAALSAADFESALTGTVAYPFAADIYAKADGAGGPGVTPLGPFAPVNPDGSLTNCVPPPHLSPLGPVEYLHELLEVSAASTCEDPLQPEDPQRLGLLLAGRRGPLGDLLATAGNLDVPLPAIDLVNESLESLTANLAAGATGGAVYDTDASSAPFAQDPAHVLAVLPQHSSPATPVGEPGAYDVLRSDFTAPELPYSQSFDICRSYLGALGSSRFSAMRHFRRDITELAIDANHEPADFLAHLWRLPVRIELALEYLEISPEEHDRLYAADYADVRELYGFAADTVDGVPWTDVVRRVPEFLRRTGLGYCEFLELWRSELVAFSREESEEGFPECEPCCPDDLMIVFGDGVDPLVALREMAVVIRLWRRLQTLREPHVSFAQLRDIDRVLHLFVAGSVNPEFIRQLAALLMLMEMFCLPMDDGTPAPPGASGAERTHILAFWVGPGAAHWDWAVTTLLDALEDQAEAIERGRRGPEWSKLLAENLDSLSVVAGFDPATATDTWHAQPTSTLRFAEVLLKLTLSEFTAGEVLFLFGVESHLDGDDPFPAQPPNEVLDDPFDDPDDDGAVSLWALRAKLLEVESDDADDWSWGRIVATLRDEFGLPSGPSGVGRLIAIGRRFFPSVLEREGEVVGMSDRQYRVPLAAAATTPAMWNTPANGPFHYDLGTEELWVKLPLRDRDVADKLGEIRQLSPKEQAAVRELYFAPRAALAPFSLIFSAFEGTLERLVHEEDDERRFALLRSEFARFHRRCHLIARHLAEHVAHATDRGEPHDPDAAWQLLRRLWGDENAARGPWEDDGGDAPSVTWGPQPTGGAFAALLGLAGTGLLGELTAGGTLSWRELRGPLSAFGRDRDRWNAPVPTVIPSLGLTLSAEQQELAIVRNGFALRDTGGEPLRGAEPFTVRWSGALLVDQRGEYRFAAGPPEHDEPARDRDDAIDAAEAQRWRVTLRRGQRRWVVLNHHWGGEDAPGHHSELLQLRRGVYEIEVELDQPEPVFAREEDVCPRHTGFRLQYSGPDSDGELRPIPFDRLFRLQADGPLDAGIEIDGAPAQYLHERYTSSLRDIRRTYQRAFKAMMLAHLFRLSGEPLEDDRESELAFLLDHPRQFAGRSYTRSGPAAFLSHRASLDLDLLPVDDQYRPPSAAQDERAAPSAKRRAAMFDWWERLFDYDTLRRESRRASERPAWRLFLEASEHQPDDPAQLLRHLGVDARHAPLVLEYFATPARFHVGVGDLDSEPWAVRAWRGEQWLRALEHRFLPVRIGDADPAGWASDEPGTAPAPNANLTAFVQAGSFENGDPARYAAVEELDDGLRLRARTALVAYLSGMDRVALPFAPGTFARTARDVGDLLLQDVVGGICQRASRIEEAISAVQAFVQRARLGLEPGFVVAPMFAAMWDGRFATFHVWECCRRREVYLENWIEWDELRAARKIEAFRFLEEQLRESKLTVAQPGGLEWWPVARPPAHPCLELLQAREPSHLRLLETPPVPEGLNLMGTPERDATPTWLAPVSRREQGEIPEDREVGDRGLNLGELARLPLWIQAAIRLGTRFVRVAAAGDPPAGRPFAPCAEHSCCEQCGEAHESGVDEYFFWPIDSRHFDPVVQDADAGSDPTYQTSAWHDPEQLPTLLDWPGQPMVHLAWSRLHNGELQPPRRSEEGVAIDPGTPLAQLDFKGRTGDSLRFEITGGLKPIGYDADPTPPGFRYDLATDAAVVLPLLVPPPAPPPGTSPGPGGLDAYPFFTYVCPGAPLEPPSMFAVGVTVASALRARCRFDAAIKWYALAYDPIQGNDAWSLCDRHANRRGEGGDGPRERVRSVEIARRRPGEDDPCCPLVVPDEATARERAVLLDYLETLLQWGENLMCRNTPEAFRQADVIFDSIERILGDRPQTILAADSSGAPSTVSDFIARAAPLNPRLLALYDRTADRLSLIHHCLNAHRLRNGRPNVDMPYFGDDPKRDGWLCPECGCCECACASCCDGYRFTFRVQRALDLATDVRALGASLLAAYEKRDAEHLAALRSAHERQLLELGLDIRRNQWRDADWQVQALQKTKEETQTRLRYYQNLIAGGLNAGELSYESSIGTSTAERAAANVSSAIAQAMVYVPDFSLGVAGIAGSPLQFNQLPLGNKLATGFTTAAHILTTLADIAASNAALSLTQAGWDRREAEWRHQVDVLTIEIGQIERQILGAERRRDVALRELNNHQRQYEHTIETENFLRDKFTNEELYLFLVRETAALHRQAFELALSTARQVERAFNYERGHTSRSFVPDGGWDDLHEGLLAGERLQLAVRQMEKAYIDDNCREYELAKQISLRLSFPLEFLRLKATGHCEIELPEWIFDLDYPGQYMRRIRNVTLSIPCVAGPYTGVHCRLTLLSSRTRIDPRLGEVPGVCCGEECSCGCDDPCCCCEGPASGYEPLVEDPRIVRAYAATEAIATSSGQNDSGLFELSFRDERYLPFEFAGAVSRWRIELPPETNQFDFDTLSDVVIHLNYTAREGGEVLRAAAAEHTRCRLPGDGLRLFDVRHDLPDSWYELHREPREDEDERRLALRLSGAMFPFLPARRVRWIDGLQLFFAAPGADPSKNHTIEFHPAGDRDEDGDGDRIDVHCIASAEYPGLFWGVVDLSRRRLGPLAADAALELGAFEFPAAIGPICDVQLVASYCGEARPACGEPEAPCHCGCGRAPAPGRSDARRR